MIASRLFWRRRKCNNKSGPSTKTVHYLYDSTRRPVHQIINCRDCGRTVPRDCGQTVPRDCGRTVPRDCRDCGRLSHRLIDVSYRRDLALWHGAVSRLNVVRYLRSKQFCKSWTVQDGDGSLTWPTGSHKMTDPAAQCT